jgi:hypothetical protein
MVWLTVEVAPQGSALARGISVWVLDEDWSGGDGLPVLLLTCGKAAALASANMAAERNA